MACTEFEEHGKSRVDGSSMELRHGQSLKS